MPKQLKKEEVRSTAIKRAKKNNVIKTPFTNVEEEFCVIGDEPTKIDPHRSNLDVNLENHQNFASTLYISNNTTCLAVKTEDSETTSSWTRLLKTEDISLDDICCIACEAAFETNEEYSNHLLEYHHFQPQCISRENRTKWYCQACKIRYSHAKSYSRHLKKNHEPVLPSKVDDFCCPGEKKMYDIYRRPRTRKEPRRPVIYGVDPLELLPDWEDPTFYCFPCEKGFGNQEKYRDHLIDVHKWPRYLKKDYKAYSTSFKFNHQCHLCGNNYSTASAFNFHLATTDHTEQTQDILCLNIHPSLVLNNSCDTPYTTNRLFDQRPSSSRSR